MSTRKADVVDKKELFERIGYKPHSDEQWQIHTNKARFLVPCCGRRFGKSQSVGHEITGKMFIPETRWWIVGPTYKLGEKEFRVVWNDLRKLKVLDKCRKSYNTTQGVMRIQTPWDSILEVVSAEKQDSLVGEGLDGACLSEAAKHKMSTWEQFIEPALSDHRGVAWFPSTPEGYNWYHGLFMMGQHPDFPDYKSWRFPTWLNQAMYPGGYDDPELKRIRSTVSEQYWLQEYGAEFTSFEGMIYPDFNESVHVRNIDYNPAWKNYLAFDFGYTDPFVCLDIMVDQEQNVYVWREYYVRHQSTWDHGWAIKHRKNPDGYHVDGRYADPRGADQAAVLEVVIGHIYREDVPWAQGIEAIRRWLKPQDGPPKLFIDGRCINLIRQLKALRAKEVKDERNERPGQHDYDDHAPDALRYFFQHHFVLGHAMSLASVYGADYATTESAGFFTHHTGIALDQRIGY